LGGDPGGEGRGLKAVLNTSVLVAAFLHPVGENGQVLAWAAERYEVCLSTGILAEVRKVLSYPWLRRYGYSGEEEAAFLVPLAQDSGDPGGSCG